MSRRNRPAAPPPKAPEPKVAEVSPLAAEPVVPLAAEPEAQSPETIAAVPVESTSDPKDATLVVVDTEDVSKTESPQDVKDEEPQGDSPPSPAGGAPAPPPPADPALDPPIVAHPPEAPPIADAAPEPPKTPEPKAPRFVLKGLGTLQCDGRVYHPGDTLPFTAAQLAMLGITHLAALVED